jgi:hypothetical protein
MRLLMLPLFQQTWRRRKKTSFTLKYLRFLLFFWLFFLSLTVSMAISCPQSCCFSLSVKLCYTLLVFLIVSLVVSLYFTIVARLTNFSLFFSCSGKIQVCSSLFFVSYMALRVFILSMCILMKKKIVNSTSCPLPRPWKTKQRSASGSQTRPAPLVM